MKVVSIRVRFWLLKSIGYLSKVPWATAKQNVTSIIPTHTSTNSGHSVMIGPLHSEIFGEICQIFPIFHTGKNEPLSPGYWTEVYQIFTGCRPIHC